MKKMNRENGFMKGQLFTWYLQSVNILNGILACSAFKGRKM